MLYYVVIPAHNESNYLSKTLDSLVTQSVLPKRVIVVDDNSSDDTATIALSFAKEYPFIKVVQKTSDNRHLPGSKVIQAFYKGYEILDESYDFIVKLDADIVLPKNYFETIINHFKVNPKVGMAGGFAYIEKKGNWVLESLTKKDHIRGAFKAYKKQCFLDIGKLKPTMGWDTADELLAQYHGWEIKTDTTLQVKHLKPTGATYDKAARYKQGEAFYKLRYGLILTCIASLKLAILKKKPFLFLDYLSGFIKAKKNNTEYLMSKEEGRFVRKLRWKGISSTIFAFHR